MQDPIGNFERIRELYISYLDTAFRIRDQNVADERRALLRHPGALCTEPLIEPIPRYAPDEVDGRDRTFDDIYQSDEVLEGFTEEERRAFIELVLAGLFPSRRRTEAEGGPLTRAGQYPPYKHQVQMLKRGVRQGSPGVVTSGTGSGKTESFLLPLLAAIAREATGWERPQGSYLANRWWCDSDGKPFRKTDKKGRDVVRYSAIPIERRPTASHPLRTPFVPHRSGERRPAAVRALVLYPMNALVEDQLVRMRKALDSREARAVMDEHFDCNRIFFGRYTSATPVTGHHEHPGLKHLLAVPKKDLSGDTYCPEHKHADPTSGRVEYARIREAETERRQRKLEELFDHQVALERGQIQARLHAIDTESEGTLRHGLLDEGCELGSTEPEKFVAIAVASGKRSGDGLLLDFRQWVGREADSTEKLQLEVCTLREQDAELAPSATSAEEAPFIFPAVDGCELTNRWDMQEHPPDILITNVSMLSAMLNREVEEPIFSKTREWLETPGAYFYLVMDELHLQRGAAGTEVAYLIRMLLHRLGLTGSEEQRGKIRILASSASLPAKPESEAANSAKYLWDMFGPFGLAEESSEDAGKVAWLKAIVPGEEQAAQYGAIEPPRTASAPFVQLLAVHSPPEALDDEMPRATPLEAKDPIGEAAVAEAWSQVADALGAPDGPLRTRIAASIVEAASRLASVCREGDGSSAKPRTRALPVSELAEKLFDDIPDDPAARLEAVRGMLFVRGSGDGLGEYLGKGFVSPPAFRVHTFFRSIEGLYAPATRGAGSPVDVSDRVAPVGVLSIDQTDRIVVEGQQGPEEHRVYELVYCECCGEIFFGGMRGKIRRKGRYVAELLPQEPNLEGLPDQAISQRFEDLSWGLYGLFWPIQDDDKALTAPPQDWRPAWLERPSGGVIPADRAGESPDAELLRGLYYDRGPAQDRHKRTGDGAGTHVPYACPACDTDYSGRSKQYRLSPLRNFRAGFAKTTQLLATELFDAQRVSSPNEPKLVSFSDSRQDAAKAALSIERFHHQDVRREILFTALRERSRQKDPAGARVRLEEARADLAKTPAAFKEAAEAELRRREDEYQREDDPVVSLADVLEQDQDVGDASTPVRPLVARMVHLGVHPFDEAGQERALGTEGGANVRFPWHRLFRVDDADGAVYWRDDDRHPFAIQVARQHAVSALNRLLTDVIFSKTYFSLEEAGLGYVTVRLADLPSERRNENRVLELASFMRVVADAYRFSPSPYLRTGESHPPWNSPGEVKTARVLGFAKEAWPSDPAAGLRCALEDLAHCGHRAGVIALGRVCFKLVEPDDRYQRCGGCGRVHLHRGAGLCTRCFRPMRWDETGNETVAALHRRSFLARRVYRTIYGGASARDDGSFRLHCEELTGQTEDPARRQREFKGIFLPRLRSIDPKRDDEEEEPGLLLDAPDALIRRKDEIDLLTVTTTMEVGIDIGPLQVVLQANMPPQRFNYQQRVGRAGRRGQAFSMALTICRTKSHDLFYFRHPKKMTGDVPPTPFLTKRMQNIGLRFLRKGWLAEAFLRLRSQTRRDGGIFPGDLMSPPDIHGEYLPRAFLPVADGTDWRGRVERCISAAHGDAAALCSALETGTSEVMLELSGTNAMKAVDDAVADGRQLGLAHCLAEAGHLPMYGMPTRVRELYLGLRHDGESRLRWSSVDRDLDLAIYEFAPGSTVVIDKREHLAIGFSPNLGEPLPGGRDQTLKAHQESAFSEPFHLVECGSCRAWTQCATVGANIGECAACGSELNPQRAKECRVPNAFRTDLPGFPRTKEEEVDSGIRHRSIQAKSDPIDFASTGGFGPGKAWSMRISHDLSRTFRINRGPQLEGGGRGFEVRPGVDERAIGRQRLWLPDQSISTEQSLAQRVANTFQPSGPPEQIWLAAPKVTDALYLTPSAHTPGLALYRLPGRHDSREGELALDVQEVSRWLGVRAAAVSASYLVVNRAALELDIDPEEFDVLEPRIYGKHESLPLIHITDNLVNGAGFCEYLAHEEDRVPRVATYIESILRDPESYPLSEFLDEEHSCTTSCYKCLRRYGNQPFHALLDWQLGLSFLRAMVDPAHVCGLDGDFELPELERWPEHAAALAAQMAKRFGGDHAAFEGVPAFRIGAQRKRMTPWILVVHPLWDWRDDLPDSILSRARDAAGEYGEPLCWDTFNLTRRQVFVRERIREQMRGGG